MDTIVILAAIFVSFVCLFVCFLWCGTTVKTRHKNEHEKVAKELVSLQTQMGERAVQMDAMREKVHEAKKQAVNFKEKFEAAKEAHILSMKKMGVPDKAAKQLVTRTHLNEMVTATKKQGSTLHALCQAFEESNAITAKFHKENNNLLRFQAQQKDSVNNLEQLRHKKQLAFTLLSSAEDQLRKAQLLEKGGADSE